jgi:hypothetical protein
MKLDLANIMLALCVVVQCDVCAAEAQSATQNERADNIVVLKGKVIDDQVIDERGKLVAGATVRAMYASKVDYDSTPENVTTASDGTFKLSRKARPLLLKATTSDERQVGIVRVEADQQQVTIRVGPIAKVSGRIVDWTGKPVQLGYVLYGIDIHDLDPASAFFMFTAGVALLDSDGSYTINGHVPGQRYPMVLSARRDRATVGAIANFVPPSAAQFDLGKLALTRDRFRQGPEPPLRLISDDPQKALLRQQQLANLLTASLVDSPYALVVQRVAGTNESTNSLPEELAENLLQVNGVKRVTPRTLDCALLDYVDFDKEGVTGVLAIGWMPEHCPLFARFQFQPGGRPLKAADQNAAVLGQNLATKLKKKIGDSIELCAREKFQIVGIYESPLDFENNGMVVPLETLQRVMGAPREVTGFAITAERPIDEQGLEELRRRLEAVQPGLEVTLLRREKKDIPTKP